MEGKILVLPRDLDSEVREYPRLSQGLIRGGSGLNGLFLPTERPLAAR